MTDLREKDDEELLSLIREGSHEAFAVLVRRHSHTFYRLAFRYLQAREPAEDVVQEAFLKLWENPGLWRPERKTKFTTWFYRVVVNLCLDWQKKKRPAPLEEAVPLSDDSPGLEHVIARAERERALERAIAELPERQRTALNLCFDQGLSNQEAAEVMGIQLKALQSLIMRAKTNLKEKLKSYL